MIIDFHTHCFPPKIVEKAVGRLTHTGEIKPYADGTAEGSVALMDSCKIDLSVVCNIATNAHQQKSVNDFAIYTNNTNKRLIALGSINPDQTEDEIKNELLRIKAAGIKGIKIHPDYIGHDIDEKCFEPIFGYCCELDMFVVTHAGWDFISPEHIHASPERIERVITAFPSLKLIAAHMGGNRMWDEVEKHLIGKHVYIDTALSFAYGLDKAQAKRMYENHFPDMILFGSDSPWANPKTELDYVMSLDISDDFKKKVTCENAKALLCM